MPDVWSRRALLASLGSVTVAGCIAGTRDEGDDTPATTSGDGATSEPQGTPTAPDRIEADWPMPGYDAGRSNFSPVADGPVDPVAELWSTAMDSALSRPILADGTLYVGGADGVVRAVDARTGEVSWQQSVGAPAGTPRAVADHLFVATGEGIVALAASDGAEAWRTGTPDRTDLLAAPHGIYWLSDQDSPVVVGLERGGGTERWRTELHEPLDAHLFASSETVLVSTGTNGRFPWRLDPGTGEVLGDEPEPGHDFAAELFSLDGTVYAVDPLFGSVDGGGWTAGVDAAGRYALTGGADRVYYLADGGEEPGLYALSKSDGSIDWTTDAVTAVVGRPVVARECVLVRSEGALHCFDPADGTERWSQPADGIGERFVVADDMVFTSRDGTLRAFRPP